MKVSINTDLGVIEFLAVYKDKKNIDNFAKDKYSVDGHTYNCYECRREAKISYCKKEESKVLICLNWLPAVYAKSDLPVEFDPTDGVYTACPPLEGVESKCLY